MSKKINSMNSLEHFEKDEQSFGRWGKLTSWSSGYSTGVRGVGLSGAQGRGVDGRGAGKDTPECVCS